MSASRPASTDRAEVAPGTPVLRGGRETASGSPEGSRAASNVPEGRRTAPNVPSAPEGSHAARSRPEGSRAASSSPDAPRSVPEAREAIASTRERLSRTADLLKRKLDVEKGRLGRRLDLATKLRRAIAGREALAAAGAFAAGLLLALAGRRKRLDRDDRKALRDWSKHRERVLAALEELEEED